MRPEAAVGGLWFNPQSETFGNNPALIRAVGYALDRPALIRTLGPFAGEPTALVIPPNVPGHGFDSPYPLDGPDLGKAQRLAAGVLRDGSPTLAFYPSLRHLADEIKRELAAIGLDVQLDMIAGVEGPRTPPRIDFWITGWGTDYPDPIGVFPQDLPAPWAQRLAHAERTTGPARDVAFALLDYDLMATDPPVMPIMVPNKRLLVSERVHCLHWNPW